MPDRSQSATPSAPNRRGPHLLSTLLFVAAIGFAAAAVIFWYYDDSGSKSNDAPPTVQSGVYGLINVLAALQAADLNADYGRSPATVTSNQMDIPGQNLKVEDTNVYIFLFSGADRDTASALREQEAANLDPDTMTLTTPSGQDVTNGEPLSIYQGANVVAVLVGGDADLQESVRTVIEGLP